MVSAYYRPPHKRTANGDLDVPGLALPVGLLLKGGRRELPAREAAALRDDLDAALAEHRR